MEDIQPGIYRHFKGGEYEVIGVARHSENENEQFVVYRSVDKWALWIRPVEIFLEHVERDGYSGPRFVFISKML